jgi:hypothetical protein
MKEKRVSILGLVVTGLTVIMALAWLFPRLLDHRYCFQK